MSQAIDSASKLSYEAERILAKQLSSAEKLLWAGQPKQGIVFRRSDLWNIPFSLLWGGFAIYWMILVLINGAPVFFVLWGIPFVLMGLYMIFGRFFVDARQRANTYYGVTNQRAVIVSGLRSQQIKSLDLQTLTDLSIVEQPDRIGTITFGATPPWSALYEGWSWPGSAALPRFEMIKEARQVYEQIRAAQKHG